MRKAGVREARQNLSTLLEYVRGGQEVLITDRGQPVARLLAPLPLSPRPFRGRAALRRRLAALEPPLSETMAGRALKSRRRRLTVSSSPVYLDTTTLAKLYLPEPGSGDIERALLGRRDLTVSDLAATELIAGLAARGARWVTEVQAAVLEDLELGVFRRAELSPRTHRAAERLAISLGKQAPVRPTAILHLALAGTVDATALVTFDSDLGAAAARLGFRCYP